MAGANILELEHPEVTVEDLFRAEGSSYGGRQPSASVMGVHKKMLEEAYALARPVLAWRELGITGAGEKELRLEEGVTLTSRLLARVAGRGEKLLCFALTLGDALDRRVEEYMKGNKFAHAYALDAAGSAFVAKSAARAVEKLTKELYPGQRTTFPLGPGHSYWKELEDLRTIHRLVGAERIGIRLTEANLMLPKKSVAMVVGVGDDLPDTEGKVHCDFCTLQKNCSMRNFNQNC